MTEIAKCVCGAEARSGRTGLNDLRHEVYCSAPDDECGWSTPPRDTRAQAIAAWNRVMRPGPRVTMRPTTRACARYVVRFGGVTVSSLNELDRHQDQWCAWFTDTERTYGGKEECRAWLISKLTAAGFDVESEEA